MRRNVPFSQLTTLAVGGPARYVLACANGQALGQALELAHRENRPMFVLGGGSNLLVSDRGFDGVVVQLSDVHVEAHPEGAETRVSAGAGVVWDDLVRYAVEQNLAGIECLSGIPGRVGAAPIQNIGAYGQEVVETIDAVYTWDTTTGQARRFAGSDCGFGYRHSRFKGADRGRYVVLRVDFRLRPGGPAALKYNQLKSCFADTAPSLKAVRDAVIALRRQKSMVYDPADPNHRSAGSFFVNPVLDGARIPDVEARLDALNLDARSMPRWPMPDGRVKLAAGWLIERSGLHKGFSLGRAGLSSKHCLAVINRGQATAADVVAMARQVRQRVLDATGVALTPEPLFLGFDRSVEELLA